MICRFRLALYSGLYRVSELFTPISLVLILAAFGNDETSVKSNSLSNLFDSSEGWQAQAQLGDGVWCIHHSQSLRFYDCHSTVRVNTYRFNRDRLVWLNIK